MNENRIFRTSFLSVNCNTCRMTKVCSKVIPFAQNVSFLFFPFPFFFIFYRDHSRFKRYHQNGETSVLEIHEAIEKIDQYYLFFFLVEIFVQQVRINERYYSNSIKPRLISIPANRIPSRIPSATSNVFW